MDQLRTVLILSILTELEKLKRERQSKSLMIEGFVKKLERSNKTIQEFDKILWITVIETVTVQQDCQLIFSFKDGTRIIR